MLKLKISISVITVISKLYSLYIKNLIRLNFIIQDKYPLFYNGLIVLYLEYCCIFKGKLSEYHLYLFLVLGFFSNDSDYFDWFVIMLLSNKIGYCLRNSHFNIKYPKLSCFILYINNMIYLLSITMCINILFNNILLPFFTKILTIVNGFWKGFVNMMGSSSKGDSAGNSTPPTPNSNPNPNSGGSSNVINASSRKKSDKKNRKEQIKEFKKSASQSELETRDAYAAFKKAVHAFYVVEQKRIVIRKELGGFLLTDYKEYLSSSDQDKLDKIVNTEIPKFEFHADDNVHEYWKNKKMSNNASWKQFVSIIQIFESNAKNIQTQLGGKKSVRSTAFIDHLNKCKETFASSHRKKDSIIKEQLSTSYKTDKLFKDNGLTLEMLAKMEGALDK